MNQLSIVNLAFEKKLKNHMPVTHLAVSDDGEVNLGIPDSYQTRLYRLITVSVSGSMNELGTFSIEKTSSTDLSRDGRTLVAATVDDIYVFRDWNKTRFFPNNRANYIAISVSGAGDCLAVAAADMIASTYTIVFTRASGAQVWMKSLPHVISCMRISADGSRILVGCEDGTALMIDSNRKVLWKLESDDPIVAAAVSPTGDISVLCTKSGVVHAVGDEGNRLWQTGGFGAIVDCAMSDDSGMVMVARSGDNMGLLEFYSPNGTPALDYNVKRSIRSIACSPRGRFVAISCADGTFLIMEVAQTASAFTSPEKLRELYEQANTFLQAKDEAAAIGMFTELLELAPCDVEACKKLVTAKKASIARHFAEAQRLQSEGDLSGAWKLAQAATAVDHYDSEMLSRLGELKRRIVSELLEQSSTLFSDGRLEEAAETIRELIKIDFANVEARDLLSRLYDAMLSKYTSEADSAVKDHKPAVAVELLERALALHPTEEVQSQLQKARSLLALEEGRALYDKKRYSQAVVQFHKALLLDPKNKEAAKYAEYAENLDESLFDRFSKLE